MTEGSCQGSVTLLKLLVIPKASCLTNEPVWMYINEVSVISRLSAQYRRISDVLVTWQKAAGV